MLWLAERSVYMRVCKHGCDVTKMFCLSWANHTSTNLKKFFSSKLNKFTLFKPIPSSAETWKIFTNKLCQFFFFAWTDILGEKNPYFGKHLLQNKNWFNTRARVRVQDFATGKNFSFNQCHNEEFCVFSRESYFFFTFEGSGEFAKVTAMYANPRPSGITVSNSPNTSHVYIRPCKHGKCFLLLKYYTRDEPITSTGYIEKQINV